MAWGDSLGNYLLYLTDERASAGKYFPRLLVEWERHYLHYTRQALIQSVPMSSGTNTV